MIRRVAIAAALVAVVATLAWQQINEAGVGADRSRPDTSATIVGRSSPVSSIDNHEVSSRAPEGERPARRISATAPRPRNLTVWEAKFLSSEDHLELINNVLAAALTGDASSQLVVFSALNECEPFEVPMRRGITAASARARQGLTTGLETYERAEQLCKRLLQSNPFIGLPERSDGYRSKAWLRMAADSGFPAAVAMDSNFRYPGVVGPNAAAQKADMRDKALRLSIEEKDATALAWAAEMLVLEEETVDLGAALQILSCDQGWSCSDTNVPGIRRLCGESSDLDCLPGNNHKTMLERRIGPIKYAQAEALAARLVVAWNDRDYEAIDAEIRRRVPGT